MDGIEERLRIGVSACLVGAPVRFDGGHRRDEWVAALGAIAELVPVCPEVEAGFGTPRPTLRLERRRGELALVTSSSGRDVGARMRGWAAAKVAALAGCDLDGFVVKRGSPSCGMERVRVYPDASTEARVGAAEAPAGSAPPTRDGRGLFTAALMAAHPLLVVEEEGRLRDAALRENFLVRLVVHRRLKRLFAGAWRRGDLVAFHTSIKLELLAHSPSAYRALGRLVAAAKWSPRAALADQYARGVSAALAVVPSRGRHVNALQHVAGMLAERLPDEDRRELAALIDDYGAGREPRATALALVRHHVRKERVGYLQQQLYLVSAPRRALGGGG